MLKNFKTYQLALQFHRGCKQTKVPSYLRNKFDRASSSVVLNVAEGAGKVTPPDQRKFYAIALGSLRESSAVPEVVNCSDQELINLADQLGGCLYRLCYPR